MSTRPGERDHGLAPAALVGTPTSPRATAQPLSLSGEGLDRTAANTDAEQSPEAPLPTGRGDARQCGVRSGVANAAAYVDPAMLARARQARRSQTPTEARAWELVRDRRCLGLKFRREQIIEGVRADLDCASLRLAIELDGGVHDDPAQRDYDVCRTQALNAFGIRVVRIRNENLSQATLERHIRPLLPLSRQGEGGGG